MINPKETQERFNRVVGTLEKNGFHVSVNPILSDEALSLMTILGLETDVIKEKKVAVFSHDDGKMLMDAGVMSMTIAASPKGVPVGEYENTVRRAISEVIGLIRSEGVEIFWSERTNDKPIIVWDRKLFNWFRMENPTFAEVMNELGAK